MSDVDEQYLQPMELQKEFDQVDGQPEYTWTGGDQDFISDQMQGEKLTLACDASNK